MTKRKPVYQDWRVLGEQYVVRLTSTGRRQARRAWRNHDQRKARNG